MFHRWIFTGKTANRALPGTCPVYYMNIDGAQITQTTKGNTILFKTNLGIYVTVVERLVLQGILNNSYWFFMFLFLWCKPLCDFCLSYEEIQLSFPRLVPAMSCWICSQWGHQSKHTPPGNQGALYKAGEQLRKGKGKGKGCVFTSVPVTKYC